MTTIDHPVSVKNLPWNLWCQQILGIVRLEIRKNFLGRRAFWIYFLALAPVFLIAIKAFMPLREEEWSQFGKAGIIYAGIFQVYYLRMGIFFGCVGIFSYLFRGEVLEKSLHFYFLMPVRREVLVVGKYLAGWLTAATLFAGSVVLSFILMYVPYGAMGTNFFSKGPGVSQLIAYGSVAILACLGYGSVFLLMGLAFRNPIIPAVAVLGWESINFLLPPFLKKISVIYYLNSLCPVTLPSGPFALLADSSPVWVAVLGLMGLTLAVVWIAGFSIRRMEISYGAD
jgi:hypothetical protein